MKVINVSDWDTRMNDMLRGRNEHEIYDMGYIDALDQMDDWLDAQPSLTLDNLRQKGRWELADDGDGVVCSECGTDFCILVYATDDFHFCPNCGADMRGGDTR